MVGQQPDVTKSPAEEIVDQQDGDLGVRAGFVDGVRCPGQGRGEDGAAGCAGPGEAG